MSVLPRCCGAMPPQRQQDAHQKRNSVFISSDLPTPSSLRSARLLSRYAVYLICINVWYDFASPTSQSSSAALWGYRRVTPPPCARTPDLKQDSAHQVTEICKACACVQRP